jgi:predicted exporter
VLDLKGETDALYAEYLHEAMRLSAAGFALIIVWLFVALRSPGRVAQVLAPLCLAVLVVAAALTLSGQQLTLLHLVGMLLIVAVGSNYALFFDREDGASRDSAPLMLASLGIANLCTVIGFGLLSFSQVPVLVALGTTVAPGAFLALLFSSLMTSRAPPAARGPVELAAPARVAPPASVAPRALSGSDLDQASPRQRLQPARAIEPNRQSLPLQALSDALRFPDA